MEENIMSFKDGLDINVGENGSFKITTGEPCECPDTVLEISPNDGGCMDHTLTVHSDSEFNCDVTFNGAVNGLDCGDNDKTILLYKDNSVINNSILAVNGARQQPSQPYITSHKVRIKSLKLLIGESNFDLDDFLSVNLYEIILNGINGYGINIFGSVVNIDDIEPSHINKLYEIKILGSDLDVTGLGNRKYRYIKVDVDIVTEFIPSALIGDIKTSISGINDVLLWVTYENIGE